MNILELKNKQFEKKDQLIDAALNEFAENGYEKASINTILKHANFSKGAFYHHFENKEELYLFIVSIIGEQKEKYFKENFQLNVNDDLFEVLYQLIDVGIKFTNLNPIISKLSTKFIQESNSDIFKKIYGETGVEIKNPFLIHIIEKAYDNGQLRTDIPKQFIINMISYLFVHLNDINKIMSLENYKDEARLLISFMKDGFKSKY